MKAFNNNLTMNLEESLERHLLVRYMITGSKPSRPTPYKQKTKILLKKEKEKEN